MKMVVRILMWIHFIYLLLLPTLAVVAAIVLFPAEDLYTQLLIFGFPAVVTYCLFLANGYVMPASLPVALIVVGLVPIQVGLGVYFFGGGSIWLFFAENAAIEIGAFVIGLMTAAFGRIRQRSGSLLLGLLLAIPCFIASAVPHIVLVFYGYGGASPWLLLFATAFVTAYLEHYAAVTKVMEAYDKKGTTENFDLRYDGGPLLRLLRLGTSAEVISPLWSGPDRTAINSRVHIAAWIAIGLPIVAGVVTNAIL